MSVSQRQVLGQPGMDDDQEEEEEEEEEEEMEDGADVVPPAPQAPGEEERTDTQASSSVTSGKIFIWKIPILDFHGGGNHCFYFYFRLNYSLLLQSVIASELANLSDNFSK